MHGPHRTPIPAASQGWDPGSSVFKAVQKCVVYSQDGEPASNENLLGSRSEADLPFRWARKPSVHTQEGHAQA